MANKTKAWREASRTNTVNGNFTARQLRAFRRHQMQAPSELVIALLQRGGVLA